MLLSGLHRVKAVTSLCESELHPKPNYLAGTSKTLFSLLFSMARCFCPQESSPVPTELFVFPGDARVIREYH